MADNFDIAVIGSGPGGYVAALKAAQMGARTALIEKDLVGGTCLNRGCIPSKAFLAAAELLHDIRHRAPKLGIGLKEGPTLDWSVTLARKNEILDEQRKGLTFLFKKREIELIEGEGSLEGPGRIVVQNGKAPRRVQADKIILAAGSRPARIPGWPESERVSTSDESLDWKTLPKSLLIVGGGVIGCEFACMMAEFGVQVTVVEMLPRLVPEMDGDLAKELLKVFKKRGIACHLETKVEDLKEKKNGVEAVLSNGEKLAIDRVLVATGRRPNSENLGLDTAGIATQRGFITVNERMETNVPGHYAIGDLNGRVLLAHAASHQGHVAVENALGHPAETGAPIPWCVYTFPEIAGVGLSERHAKERDIPVSIGQFPFSALGKARAYGDSEGFVKVIRHRETDVLVGIHAIGHAATEFIAAAGVLLHTRATAQDVMEMVFAHPTMSEAVREATEMSAFAGLHLPPPKMHRIAV
ncbi:dihydrolipoyl dehydrogenase [bacterium]|nr:dihydrolipoyl dehydrogenase [bacterium]